MPIPLIPFVAGALVGALATYALRDRLPNLPRPGRAGRAEPSAGDTAAVPAADAPAPTKPRAKRSATKRKKATPKPSRQRG